MSKLNNKHAKKILSVVLAFVLAIGFVAFDTSDVKATSAVNNTGGVQKGSSIYFGSYPQINIGVNTPSDYSDEDFVYVVNENAMGSEQEKWRIYFKRAPIEWEVIESNNGELLLMSKKMIDATEYDLANSPDWESSDLRSWLNTRQGNMNDYIDGSKDNPSDLRYPHIQNGARFLAGNFYSNAFSTGEQPGIKLTTLPNGGTVGNETQDHVFILTYDQIRALSSPIAGNSEYLERYKGSTGAPARQVERVDEWMGMPVTDSLGLLTVVDKAGNISTNKTALNARKGLRPAIRLDRNTVVMVSKENSKSNAVGLAKPDPLSGNLKLTVASDALSLNVKNLANLVAAQKSDGLTFEYENASTGTGKYLSAVLEKDGKIEYYGVVKDLQNAGDAAGTATIPLTNVDEGNYTLKIFVEEPKSGLETDIASKYKQVSLAVTNITQAPEFALDTPPAGSKTDAYEFEVKATGIPAPVLSLKSGSSLPPGLTFNQNGDSDNKIKGVPTVNGTTTFKIEAQGLDASKNMVTVEKEYTIVITDTAPPVIPASTNLGTINTGAAYSMKIETGAIPAPSVTLESGILPNGLILDADGTIHGTPTRSGVFNFNLKAVNGYGFSEGSFTITVVDPETQEGPFITTATLGEALYNSPYSQIISTRGYPTASLELVTPVSWLELIDNGDGTAVLKNKTGQLPPQGAVENILIRAYHSYNGTPFETTKTYVLKVIASAVIPSINAQTLPDAKVGTNYVHAFSVNGAPTPTLSIISGNLPNGVAINGHTIKGTPTEHGTFNFVVEASNSAGSVNQSFSLVVNDDVLINPITLSDGKQNTSYNAQVSATGYPAPTFSLSSGTLPQGITIQPDGKISGKPTNYGTFTFTIEANNGVSSDLKQLTLKILEDNGETPVDPDPPLKTDKPSVDYAPKPMKFDVYQGPRSGSISISLGESGSTTMASRADITVDNNIVNVSKASVLADERITVSHNSGTGSSLITVIFFDHSGNVMNEYTKNVSINVIDSTPSSVVPGRPGGSSGGGGGGGGGGGTSKLDKSPFLKTPANTTGELKAVDVDSIWDKVVKSVPGAIKKANADNRNDCIISVQNGKVLTFARAKEIVEAAKKNGGGVILNADTVVQKSVLVRIKLDTRLVDRDIKLDADINTPIVEKFALYFQNKITGITFAHKNDIGQTAQIAAKLDLEGFDLENLVLYEYNSELNKYSKLKNQEYKIDKNGYLHFEADALYSIIVIDGELVSK